MPNIHAISDTVDLVSLKTISFTFDKISSRDADFGFPDLGAFSMDSNPKSNVFFHLQSML